MGLGQKLMNAMERLKNITLRTSLTNADRYKADTYRQIVCDYVNSHLDKSDKAEVTLDDVYVVWSCKTLTNFKCLISTSLLDGMYYELTYNGDKDEAYLDAYKKFENRVIKF